MAVTLVINRNQHVPAEQSPVFGAIAERFRRAGELTRAVTLCHDGLRRFPDHLSARVTLGWALLDLGQLEEARGELESVLKRAPDNLAAIRGLAQLHDQMDGHDGRALPPWPADPEPESGPVVPEPSFVEPDVETPVEPELLLGPVAPAYALEDVWPDDDVLPDAPPEPVDLGLLANLERMLRSVETRRGEMTSGVILQVS